MLLIEKKTHSNHNMKKLLIRGLAALSLLLAAGTTKAQAPGQLPAVPEDPEVRIGHLDNGLT